MSYCGMQHFVELYICIPNPTCKGVHFIYHVGVFSLLSVVSYEYHGWCEDLLTLFESIWVQNGFLAGIHVACLYGFLSFCALLCLFFVSLFVCLVFCLCPVSCAGNVANVSRLLNPDSLFGFLL